MSDKKVPKVEDMSVDEFYEELKQHPAFMTDYDSTQPLPEALEGLQAIKYQSDNCDENAFSYKEDGNKNFQLGKYRWAVDSYTEGIKCKPADPLLNAVLYTNRAASNYRIGNYRLALNDCMEARKFKSDHVKAIMRGAMCNVELELFTEAITWCDEALELCPTDEKMKSVRIKADKLMRERESRKRRDLAAERKEERERGRILAAVEKRGVVLSGADGSCSPFSSQAPTGAKVHLNSDGVLVWPVMFLYPEYGETDFVEAFSEVSSFADHLDVMFGTESPAWDADKKYQPGHLQVLFEDKNSRRLYGVDVGTSLLAALQHKQYTVHDGIPCFLIVVQDSPFAAHFIARYSNS